MTIVVMMSRMCIVDGGRGGLQRRDDGNNQPTSGGQPVAPSQLPIGSTKTAGIPPLADSVTAAQQHDVASTENQEALQSDREMGREFHIKYPPVRLRDHVTHTVFANSPSLSSPVSSHPSGTPYPLTHYIHCDNFSNNYRKFIAAVVNDT